MLQEINTQNPNKDWLKQKSVLSYFGLSNEFNMRINSLKSGILELLSSCVVHILYFNDFHSTPHSQCTKVTKMGHGMLQLAPYFPNPHPHLPTASVQPTMPKRNSNSLSFTICFLVKD